ncbi:MAG: DUF952 domain-containing protein [Bacteroidetes bacterium]|nr:DUF952 domain-containing protein [Bacteroidota bacterium]
MESGYIYHITTAAAWEKAQTAGAYTADSLASEGFIHCSTQDQVPGVLDRYYKGQTNLVKLTIEKSKVTSPLIFELATSINEVFPHIHGPINLSAVVKTESI